MADKTFDSVIEINDENIDLALTLTCGQEFRFRETDGVFYGVVGVGSKARAVMMRQTGSLINISERALFNESAGDKLSFWRAYLDLDRDYESGMKTVENVPVLAQAAKEAKSVRILKQDFWEALCSFVISQNNNIPRIMKIVNSLCALFGTMLYKPEEPEYALFEASGIAPAGFPSPTAVLNAGEKGLAAIRAGFRVPYILAAARSVCEGTVSAQRLAALSTDDARRELMKLHGVGQKVADCTLLYGMARFDVFPADVWIKRALDEYFDGKNPLDDMSFAGPAQQYLFLYIRRNYKSKK